MANIFETQPVYIDTSTLRESTTNPDLKNTNNISDSNINILIDKSQSIIDDVIWDYWTPAEDDQDTIFPLLWESLVPIKIQKATLLLVENLYTNWVLDWDAYELWGSRSIKSETSRWHTVSYYWDDSISGWLNEFLNEEILMYLKPYYLNLSTQWLK